MDRSGRAHLAMCVALLLVFVESVGSASGQAPAAGPPSSTDLAIALGRTRDQGVPTIVVATSTARPGSKQFWRGLTNSAFARSQRGMVQFVELPVEENPNLAQQLQIGSCPTIVVYSSSRAGVACRGARTFEKEAEALAWLESLGLVAAPTRAIPGGDLGIVRAAYDNNYPSAQQQSPAAPQAPLSAPAPMMAMPMMMPQAPASVIQVPGPNLVIQQGQPNVFVTQAAPTYAPAYNYAPQAAMPAPSNMFLPVATAPMMMAAAPAAAPAPVAAAPVAAMTSQSMTLPMTASKTSVRVRGPGFINYHLAKFGEKLVQRGRSTIETVQETELGAPQSQVASGIATISTTSATPVSVPQMIPAAPQVQPPATPQNGPPPQPIPAPQTQTAPHKHLFWH